MEVLLTPFPVAMDFTEDVSSLMEDPEEQLVRDWLAAHVEAELRTARSRVLLPSGHAPSEVLLPTGLLSSIAGDILTASRDEPLGLRGCLLRIHYEDKKEKREIGAWHCDPTSLCTFELHLTLRPDSSSWTAKLPQFLKSWAGRNTVVVSSDYSMTKKKLYRSSH